ncbi:MAG TPA: hypothetical protein VFA19_09335 [Gaiellaceae bacterium]|nr:hypothetical protein [Gaiellaceae bacterium]
MNGEGERAGRKEALFREVNEEVRDLADHAGALPDQVGFVCECSDEGCSERVQVPLAVYEETRSYPRRFIVAPGHEGGHEHVVSRSTGYVIVEKDGEAARVAAETDPRG